MTIKFKARLVYERVYEVDIDDYGTEDVNEALKIDRENLNEDPTTLFEEDDIIERSVELIDES